MPSAWEQIHTDFYQAQVIFQAPSGLPTDQFVNTFTFRNDNVFDRNGMADAVEGALTSFYSTQRGTTPSAIVEWMPTSFTPPQLKLFDLGETPPRVPIERTLTGVDPSSTGTALPREVAVCASYHVGGPGPRNRGRIFIGPITDMALDQLGGTFLVGVQQDLQECLTGAMEYLATDPGLECTWVLWSRANNAMYNVVGGWVDNAFDTQRSRGKEPSQRTTWGQPIASGVGGYPGGRPGDTSQWT